jgi:hypothetical protein
MEMIREMNKLHHAIANGAAITPAMNSMLDLTSSSIRYTTGKTPSTPPVFNPQGSQGVQAMDWLSENYVSPAPQFTRYMWNASLTWLFVTGLLILVVYIIAHCSSLNRTTFFSLYVRCCPVLDLTNYMDFIQYGNDALTLYEMHTVAKELLEMTKALCTSVKVTADLAKAGERVASALTKEASLYEAAGKALEKALILKPGALPQEPVISNCPPIKPCPSNCCFGASGRGLKIKRNEI